MCSVNYCCLDISTCAMTDLDLVLCRSSGLDGCTARTRRRRCLVATGAGTDGSSGGLLVALAEHVGPVPRGLRAAGGDDGDLLGGGVDVDDADLRLHLLGHEDGVDDALLGLLDVPSVSGAAQVLETAVGRLARLGGLVTAHGPDVLDDAL